MRPRTWIGALAIVLSLPGYAHAKSYSVESIDSSVEVRTDASVRVTETITYSFRGSFRFAYRDIPLKEGETLSEVTVGETGQTYTERRGKAPGTYRLSGSDPVRITWYFRVQDDIKRFILSYSISGVVRRYPDIAVFDFQFVGDDWDRRIGKVTASVELPDGLDATDLRAWAHGPLNGTVKIASGSRVQFDVSPLPPRTFWEGRIAMPARALSSVPLTGITDRLPAVLAEEKRWADEANARREAWIAQQESRAEQRERMQARSRIFFPVAWVLGMIGAGVWFNFFRRFGKPHEVESFAVPGEIPSDHSPAMVSYLMTGQIAGNALVATLLDLANRGHFEIIESEEEKRRFFGGTRTEKDFEFKLTDEALTELTAYETELVSFLMSRVGDGRSFKMSEMKKIASKNRTEFRRWFMTWTKSVREAGKRLGFFESYPRGVVAINLIVGLSILAVGIILCVTSDSLAGLPAIIGGGLQASLTVSLRRRTPEGRRLLLGWKNFRTHLKTISKAMGPVSLSSGDWGRYLGAAIIFGMHDKLMPKLRLAEDGGVYPVWYYPVLGSRGGSDVDSIASLADGFSSMVSSVSSTMSSASGTGGGASAGGGGGSGGGGGGAG
jgi:uncharacterized membrane protein